VIVPDPNQPPTKPVTEYWCPLGGANDCVPFHEVFDAEARYEEFGELDGSGAPVTLFADAINVQPWEMCPPSASAFARTRTMDRDYATSASALPVQEADQPTLPEPSEDQGGELDGE
jgi:hypothetical protein